ncbi:hypothetical protein M8997_012745 [Phyllobacterium sp. 21LDTY02-6]|uniref:hypothetical protein n=1 Tax=unclassified Phyllobacterium TaxID=2638441 RepID=UPI002021C22C|nr:MULTISPECIES: hypothetical protein [unclassified Phyllobacterium]MCO4318053.1 hypothetical protein [Phyllobacterium sp. 21LDTY02-6]MCX8280047.1 hypothetical protein [Phyllobacterium sp. 0TCS1.6C]MCX8294391.1 hypothetical protein [Phyllobacterium sp. 0TCS1.6A]
MIRLLSIVEVVFELAGRSSVVVGPGVPRAGKWRLEIGMPLILKLPDATELRTVVGGFEMLSPPDPGSIPLMLGPGLSKHMVPIGTEIWADYPGRGD